MTALELARAALPVVAGAPLLAALIIGSFPERERGLGRLVVAVGAMVAMVALVFAASPLLDDPAAIADVMAGSVADATLEVAWDSGWRPLTLAGAAPAQAPSLKLVLSGWTVPLLGALFVALLVCSRAAWAFADAKGIEPTNATLARLCFAASLAVVAICADDILIIALAWLGVRMSSAMAMRTVVRPVSHRPVERRAALGFVLGWAVVAAAVYGGLAVYDLSDGVFVTSREALSDVILPLPIQYGVAGVLLLSVVSSVGLVPFHRGTMAGMVDEPRSAATALVIDASAALAALWVIGDALAPVVVAEFSDALVGYALLAVAWSAAVASVRREEARDGSTLHAVASLAAAAAIFGIGLARTHGLLGTSLGFFGAAMGLCVAAGGLSVPGTRGRVVFGLGLGLAIGFPPSPGFFGVLSLVGAALRDETSQMRWPVVFALAFVAVGLLVAVVTVRAASATSSVPGETSDLRARRRLAVWSWFLVALVGACAAVAGPMAGRARVDALRMDEARGVGRCIGVSARTLRHEARRSALPVDCDGAHRALRRAYGLDQPPEGEGAP